MRLISISESNQVGAGIMDPHALWCLNTKIQVSAGAGEADFDVNSAAWALNKACPMEFPTFVEGEAWANMINNMIPPMPIFPIPMP